jgi:hypothetical protein
MPTVDASQFTQFKKFQAAQSVVPNLSNSGSTRLSQSLARVSAVGIFLPPPGKSRSINSFTRINVSLGIHGKPKIPGGNVFGGSVVTIPRVSTLILDGGTPAAGGPVTFFGGTPTASGAAIYDGGNP